MSLDLDARAHCTIITDIAVERISTDILNELEDDLDIDEKLSILFLMTKDYKCPFTKNFEWYSKAIKNTYIITEYVKSNLNSWRDELLEAICICNNKKVIRNLGMSFEELEVKYVIENKSHSENLNSVFKCLYLLCESLSKSDTKLLLNLVSKDIVEYESKLADVNYLELHLLYWIEVKYISIFSDKEGDLRNLLEHLKNFKGIEIITKNLESYQVRLNASSTSNCTNRLTSSSGVEEENPSSNNVPKVKIKKGLCIIINQMYFNGGQYETRYGTNLDCRRLQETFNGFKFKVHTYENLCAEEIITKIGNIPKDFGTDYDCIFLCILSHGCKGSIIASDEVEISIEKLDNTFCCTELTNVIKVVITQACQGKNPGKVYDSLSFDSPSDIGTLNVTASRNFCMFISTIQGFASVRDTAKGTWFIQEFCNVLQNRKKPITFCDCAMTVMNLVQNKRGKVQDGEIVQQPELRNFRINADFELPLYSP